MDFFCSLLFKDNCQKFSFFIFIFNDMIYYANNEVFKRKKKKYIYILF